MEELPGDWRTLIQSLHHLLEPVVMDFLPLVHTERRWVGFTFTHSEIRVGRSRKKSQKPSGRRKAKFLC